MRIFNEFWSEYDPHGEGFISIRKLPKLINMIINEEIKMVYNFKN